jgi:hypothetical protein
MAILCITIKLFIPNVMSTNELYRPRWSLTFIAHNYGFYIGALLFQPSLSAVCVRSSGVAHFDRLIWPT